MRKIICCLVIIIIAINYAINYFADDDKEIPNIDEPKQYNLSQKKMHELKYVREIGDWKILILPLAHYEISAKVLNARSYIFGLDAAVSPHDIGVAWGIFKDEKNFKKIHTHYGTRFLYYRWQTGEFDENYTKKHIANIHIIPKNNDLLKKIQRIRKGDEIYLKGYLVRAEGLNTKTNAQYERQSSLTREDTGNGACETMYVTDVIYNHRKRTTK